MYPLLLVLQDCPIAKVHPFNQLHSRKPVCSAGGYFQAVYKLPACFVQQSKELLQCDPGEEELFKETYTSPRIHMGFLKRPSSDSLGQFQGGKMLWGGCRLQHFAMTSMVLVLIGHHTWRKWDGPTSCCATSVTVQGPQIQPVYSVMCEEAIQRWRKWECGGNLIHSYFMMPVQIPSPLGHLLTKARGIVHRSPSILISLDLPQLFPSIHRYHKGRLKDVLNAIF